MISLLILSSLPVNAQIEELERVAEETKLKGETDIPTIVGRIINIIIGFLGLILVIIIIYGGFLWMTSGGNEEQIKKARGLITSAVVGIGIVILSYAIAHFVIERLQEVSKTQP